jgi:hypothetical protein
MEGIPQIKNAKKEFLLDSGLWMNSRIGWAQKFENNFSISVEDYQVPHYYLILTQIEVVQLPRFLQLK